ncbi:PQQ-dependent sugar dehydrogenase [Streptomyces stelliscabiei]|uniref:PQQ-dependent sugar dehydrogenase n=1 Tax=Streptomyces stelliscabiei TaxID=146820 RepID=UPI0029A2B7C1|nr:PQQ-dependent sugar dehydrogenase [Streptomyces stelliscabiei]MDX2554496.1 PQQ-dependent sugar dehydrogenase [Streptomyces stelliscabiei]MDX2613705.1 PQQ-dependent sugar dehydrogenase [Streptomyces stelliscabiei]MDX2639299.1 PQQ-dependent sugar dehydrogenase [Streptomyces stelliscabiei]MDX2662936.1 PQQ-dependent sugar dehydrogenase [Streptomyces stelliscabiei]MDX2715501.1 PQQ-dependent sugar dehydrogenase [Streptomyces stelliscabiei]
MTAALAAAVLLVTTGCSSDDGEKKDTAGSSPPSSSSAESPPPERAADTAPPAKGSVKVVRTVTEDLDTPWGLAPLPEGGLLVSSRDEATISRIDEESGEKTVLGEVPGVAPAGEGGLLGLAVSPEYASDHMIYAYFTSASDNRIVRMLYDPEKPAGEQLGAPDTILRGIPKGTNHNGGRLAFGPDQMLYASTGERYEGPLAQDKDSLGGKILRMTPEGLPAPGNPFDDSVVYSYGHRNVQGLAWDAKQRLWASEFGQNTWDELNQIRPGGNYGWPEVEGKGGKSGYVDPVAVWRTDEASPSGIAIAEGSVWMAGLKGRRLWRVPLDGTKTAAAPQAFLEGDHGRLRTVVSAGGDRLWLVTSETDGRGSPQDGDDKILELRVK